MVMRGEAKHGGAPASRGWINGQTERPEAQIIDRMQSRVDEGGRRWDDARR